MTSPDSAKGPSLPTASHPCIWMSAGLLSYRLCDRAFDCERCPLDLALRCEPRAEPVLALTQGRRRPPPDFPDDRRYAAGHTWVRVAADGTARVGVDAFAAQLIDCVHRVLGPRRGALLSQAAELCVLDTEAGELTVRAPCSATVLTANPALRHEPGLVLSSPNDRGWLAELRPAKPPAHTSELHDAAAARQLMELDLRRFRRQVALELLAGASTLGPTLADGGERLTSLSRMLGTLRYRALLQEFLT